MFRFLIIDDVEIIREAICADIKRKYPTITLFTAGNGYEALKIVEKQEVDCVLTDIKMPGCDGLELIKKLRE
ncbi:MAG: response regulator [Anaerocolumna sp.]